MIPLPANVKLVVGLLLVGAVGAASALLKVEPSWSWLGTVVQLATALELYFTVPAVAAKKPAGFGQLRVLVGLAMLGAVAVVAVHLAGCQQVEAAFPALEKIEQTVAADLAAGKTDEQMASDVCADLGGSASTDAACADAVTLVQDAVTLLVDSGALSGSALANAKSYRARHSGLSLGGGQ